MRRWLTMCLIGLGVVAISMLGTSDSAAQNLPNTKHDFRSTSTGATIKDSGSTATLCNTCHIPHGASTTVLLWNHTLSTTAFTWGETTTGGTSLPTTFTGPTKQCLSCHDGTVDVGNVIAGTDWGVGTKITGAAKVTGASNTLSGNHPVGVPYPATGSTSYNGVSIGASVNTADYVASPTSVKIYSGTGSNKGIECSSCHNPHGTTNTKFLRVAAASLCDSCHIK